MMGVFERWFWRTLIALMIAWAVWGWVTRPPLRPTVHTRGGVEVKGNEIPKPTRDRD